MTDSIVEPVPVIGTKTRTAMLAGTAGKELIATFALVIGTAPMTVPRVSITG